MAWTAADQNLKEAGLTKAAAKRLREDPSTLSDFPDALRALVVKYSYLERTNLLDHYIEWVDVPNPNG